MENNEKKSIFELMSPASAMIAGLVVGILALCTIGFIILGVMAIKGGVNCSANTSVKTPVVATTPTNQPVEQTEPVAKAPKNDKPKVELFIMTYCPYGLQMQKAFLPVMSLLGKKADLSVKYVSYAMHGQKELDENTRQYCIAKDQATKYVAYATCFTAKGDATTCLKETGINEKTLNACVAKTDKEFKITELFNDQSTWLSGRYPLYNVHQKENETYGVQGSPTLVINGVQINANRNADAVKVAVCDAFNKAPAECDKALSTQSLQAGFGAGAGAATEAACE